MAAQEEVGGNLLPITEIKLLPCVWLKEADEALPYPEHTYPWENDSNLWERGSTEEVNTACLEMAVTPLK